VRAGIAAELSQLEARQRDRADFIDAHPDVMGRIAEVGRAIEVEQQAAIRCQAAVARRVRSLIPRRPAGIASQPPSTPAYARPPVVPEW
jgi:hypothetical protein